MTEYIIKSSFITSLLFNVKIIRSEVSFLLFILPIFFGSVFYTSEKFVNVTNAPKFYFFVVCALLAVAFVATLKNRIVVGSCNKKLLWSFYVVCIAQAVYGLFQLMAWFSSNHSKFTITGSFDNPAGFAAVLAIGFPIGLYLLIKSKKFQKYLAGAGVILILAGAILSSSRTGLLSIFISSVVFVFMQTSILKRYKYYKKGYVILLIFLIIAAYVLFHQKKDSAIGRLLIWKVSTEMIKDKPITGHGYGAFQASYMDYQAEYFENNPYSKYSQLADNVKHPFNEFVKVTVEFGIIGLAILLSVILFVLLQIMKSKSEIRPLVLSGLASFLVFACFSYPLQYVAIWLLLAFYFALILPSKEIRVKHTPISIIARVIVVIACTFSFFHLTKQIQAEIKWKKIAVNSLRGNTEEMLPEYEKLYSTSIKRNPFFLYNYGAELNIANKFEQSTEILNECKKRFNDYDLQMLLADNYHKKGELEKAIQIYEHASNMIPCRFLSLYNLFELYRKNGRKNFALKYALEIINKKVKVDSSTVSFIKSQAEAYLNDN